ncbi:hypothetical protein BJY01DRAFT_239231 [Aspergillus pseudoustus]|uniref:Zn(2)-C6 fungal-type domain-containing protein n=1 Tax=Aspergillus pseudoustus TaxID=1810923 RepID=A0ABR4J3I5_9EURO
MTATADNACLSCSQKKRRCDRAVPACSTCRRLGLSCIYWNGPNATFTHDTAVPYFVKSLAVQRVDAGGSMIFPVPERKEMPMLLHSCKFHIIETFGMAPLPVDKGSLAFSLRTSWASQALSDPCSFHATLFSASAHLDAFRGESYNYVTTYHYTTAMRLIREKLALPGAMPDEKLIACIPAMVFFSSLRGDKQSSQIHRNGLMQLLRAKGGLAEFELDGFFSALIPVCVMTEAIVFASELEIPGIEIPSIPFAPPTQLLSGALERAAQQTGYYNLSPEAVQIFKDIRLICKTLHKPESAKTTALWRDRLRSRLTEGLCPIKTNRMDAACHAAALIFLYLLFHNEIGGPNTTMDSQLEILLQDLKIALLDTRTDTWIRSSPEALTWISLVGAAASIPASADRIWFTLRFGQPVMCIRSEGASLYMDCWMLYSWVNLRRKDKISVVEIG